MFCVLHFNAQNPYMSLEQRSSFASSFKKQHKDIPVHKENYKIFVGSLPRKIKEKNIQIFFGKRTHEWNLFSFLLHFRPINFSVFVLFVKLFFVDKKSGTNSGKTGIKYLLNCRMNFPGYIVGVCVRVREVYR